MQYEDNKSIKKTEPRIMQIQEQLSALMGIIDLEYDGQPVKVNGFRLKELSHWEVLDRYGVEGIVAHLARKCDSDCCFCYHKGNPPDFPLGKSNEFVSEAEIETRVKYFKPKKGTTLFLSNYEQKEILYDPKTIKYLKRLREKTNELFTINTNGLGLTRETVRELKALEPVMVVFSVNYVNQKKRDQIMNNTKANNSVEIMRLLSRYEIPFVDSIAMWPTVDINDIEEAIRITASYSPYYIRLIMPGYTNYFEVPPKETVEEFEAHFAGCVERILELREYVDVPVVLYPEAYIVSKKKFGSKPYLVGVVKNSPLCKVGIRAGDIIIGINGIPTDMRSTVKNMLNILKQSNIGFTIKYQRGEEIANVRVDPNNYGYPYSDNLVNAPLGALFSGGLNISYVEEIEKIIKKNGAKNILLMTSALMISQARDVFEKAKCSLITDERKIEFCIPKNNYLGGNICIGDMLAGTDYIEAINRAKISNPHIDLIIIPESTFFGSSGWKRDISGVFYKHIEWKTGIKTELLDCQCFIF